MYIMKNGCKYQIITQSMKDYALTLNYLNNNNHMISILFRNGGEFITMDHIKPPH